MAQLDLFGNIIQPTKPAKSAGKTAAVLPEKPAEDAIFVNNGNAGFKVKLKTTPTAAEPLVEEPKPQEALNELEDDSSTFKRFDTVVEEEPLPKANNELPSTIFTQEIEQVDLNEGVEKAVQISTEPSAATEAFEQKLIAVETADTTGTNELVEVDIKGTVINTTNTITDTVEPTQVAATADYLPYPPTVPLEAAGKRGRLSFKEMEESAKLLSVPSKEELYQKQYYSISTVASWFNVNISLLRFWENEFDIIQPRKTRKGDRLFRPQDVENLQIIHYLLRVRKFSIQGAKQYLAENKGTIDTQVFLQQTLQNFKIFLTELKANLES